MHLEGVCLSERHFDIGNDAHGHMFVNFHRDRHLFLLIGQWLRQSGRAVISVVHDLSTAKKFGTHALLLDRGRAVSSGAIDRVLTRENLSRVYGMDVYGWMRSLLSQWED